MTKTLAVLGYHKIGEPAPGNWETWYYVPASIFANQLAALHSDGWTPIDAEAFVRGVEQPDTLPDRAAVVTFDDGYESVLHSAAPILERMRFPAIMFVPTQYIGRTNAFDEGIEPQERICSWDQLAELERRGVSIQSHGVSHRTFSSLSPEELCAEMKDSRKSLEKGLNKRVEVFAFPFGDAGSKPEQTSAMLADAGYRAACLYQGSCNYLPAKSPFLLHRLPMGPETDPVSALRSKSRDCLDRK